MLLRVSPRRTGDNEIGLDLADRRRPAETGTSRVILRLTRTGIGTEEVETESSDGRRFTARGSYFSLHGVWQVEVIVRRTGFDDVRHVFDVRIREPS